VFCRGIDGGPDPQPAKVLAKAFQELPPGEERNYSTQYRPPETIGFPNLFTRADVTGVSEGVWRVVELRGYRRYAGRVHEVTLFGRTMGRVDVPRGPTDADGYDSVIFHADSIYCISPSDEQKVRAEKPWEPPGSFAPDPESIFTDDRSVHASEDDSGSISSELDDDPDMPRW
jgi:hypothetical protein